MKIWELTIFDLRTDFNPEALRVRIMQVDDFGKEDDDSSSPKY